MCSQYAQKAVCALISLKTGSALNFIQATYQLSHLVVYLNPAVLKKKCGSGQGEERNSMSHGRHKSCAFQISGTQIDRWPRLLLSEVTTFSQSHPGWSQPVTEQSRTAVRYAQPLRPVRLSATPRTVAKGTDVPVHGVLQARILEVVATPPPGVLPNPGIKSRSSALKLNALPSEPSGKPKTRLLLLLLLSCFSRVQLCATP